MKTKPIDNPNQLTPVEAKLASAANPRRSGNLNKGIQKRKQSEYAISKNEAMLSYRRRVARATDSLFNSQYANAVGNTYVYKIVETGEGRNSKKIHVLVTDPQEIKEILDTHMGASGLVNDEYYMITTAKPDNAAIKDMLDRTYGTATQTVITEDADGNKIPLLTSIQF